MNKPGADPTRVENTRSGVIETDSADYIPLGFNYYSPVILNRWRERQFLIALQDRLGDREPTEEEVKSLKNGSAEAVRLAESYDPTDGVTVFSADTSRVIELLGMDEFRQIYDMTPPPELIDHMMSEGYVAGYRDFFKPDLGELTVQVLKGRMKWDERFTAAGVPTPEEYVARRIEEANQRIECWQRGVPRGYEVPEDRIQLKLAFESLAQFLAEKPAA